MTQLRLLSGPQSGKKIEVGSEHRFVIGRDDACNLVLDDPEVSRRHAYLIEAGGGIEVGDLGSSNGTRLNGRRVEQPTQLKPGDTLEIGGTRMQVDASTAVDPVEPAAAALAATSPHIFSQAIAVYAQQHLKTESHSTAVSLSAAGEHNRSVSGRGVAACLRDEETVTALGNRPLMDELGLIVPGALEAELEAITQSGQPLVLLGWDGIVQGVFAMAETLRLSAHPVIDWCREQKLDVAVLTGDHQLSGQRLQRELGVPVESALTPVEKAEHVRNLHQHGSNVVFVGDGVNDAPALAVADIGITLGCGADVTRDSADVCLLSDDIGQLPELIELSRQTVSIIRSNLAWAFGYNFCGVLIATTGLLHPAIAAALMVGSSVYVITNSLRLAPPVELQPPAAITAASSRSQQHPESPAASKANQPLEEVVS